MMSPSEILRIESLPASPSPVRSDWWYFAYVIAVTWISGIGLGLVISDQGWL